jgi:NADH-quinone oxidoreductase subunit N
MNNFDIALLAPEIFLLSMTCLVLLVDLFIPQRTRAITYGLSLVTLLGSAILVLRLYHIPPVIILNGSFIWDPIACLLQLFILIVSLFTFVYARDYIRDRKMPEGEYYILALFSVLGMLVLVSAYSFLTVFLGLELLSLPLYAMVALQRDSGIASEAAMKYFVTGSLASAMLLYGMSMLYGATHSIQLNVVAHAITFIPPAQQLILVFGLVFIVAGLVFKLGAVPFHMWVPDVYQGAPTSVTLLAGSTPKIAALGMAIRLLVDAMPSLQVPWQEILTLVVVTSIALGNLVAIAQTNLKRMLSYSAIAHVGYALLGFVAVTPAGFAATVFYIIAYAIMTTGGFAILVYLSKAGFDAESIDDLRGLNARNPWFAFMMLLVMFSMAGIPPSVGFFAKLGVLEALITVHKVWLATYALVFAIIGAYYYLNVIKVMYFEAPVDPSRVVCSKSMQVALTVNGLAVLVLGIFPSTLIQACRAAFSIPL